MPEGLRERKKRETRVALVRAALELCERHGVEQVTVADIAAAANVSRRTFFNYFASRDEAILGGGRQRAERLAELLAARPAGEPAWAALRGAWADHLTESAQPEREWLARARLVRSSPSLVGQQQADFAEMERLLGIEVARRLGAEPADLEPRLLVATAVVTVRVAVHHWIDAVTDEPLHASIDAALARVGAGLDRSLVGT